MRPLLLHLHNFASFREPALIDFTDADYFALVGPTGAGKSTVIDGLCFAMYGSVPRWGRENIVSLALPPSAGNGRVALVFEVAGRRYGVVRVLVRTTRGAVITREAVLDELDPTVPPGAGLAAVLDAVVRPVAEGERVSRAMPRITGLAYRHFTRAVVLPQGRFAAFLHATPRERQDLLVTLLDAEVYDRIRRLAVQEEESAKQAALLARRQLAELAGSDAAAERAAAERVGVLRRLATGCGAALEALGRLDRAAGRVGGELAAARRQLTGLTVLAMPRGVPRLAERLRQAERDAVEAAEAVDRAEAAEHEALEELAGLGDKTALVGVREAHAEAGRLAELARKQERALVAASESAHARAEALEAAQAALAAAQAALAKGRDAAVAADLASRLSPGEPCPVCHRPVGRLPHHSASAEIADLEWRVEERTRELDQARKAHQRGELRFARQQQAVENLTAQRDALAELLAGAPPAAELDQRLAAIALAGARAERARESTRAARAARGTADRAVRALVARAERAWAELDAARDTVVGLGAPQLRRDDPQAAWTALLGWRDETAARVRAEVDELAARAATADRELRAAYETLMADIARAGVTVALPGSGPAGGATGAAVPPVPTVTTTVSAAVAEAASTAAARLARIRADRARARELTAAAETAEGDAEVAHELALMLRANNFEKWLCAEALEALVDGASAILRELSGGQYEMRLDQADEIEIVDYAEAGLARSARTLSGGETFQAGLALALALAEQVGSFAATAARSLDSVFLDEGFGTLDPATLDTVAVTLERLAAGGERMVGVVTHVPALADRVPVRFEVGRDGAGSHIRKLGLD